MTDEFEMAANFDPSNGVVIFTDGSAYTVDRSGGWSYVMIDVDHNVITGCGRADDTTISRMELEAPTRALTWLHTEHGSCDLVAIYSDSQYVVLGCNDRSRKRNKNVDCWNLLDEAIELHECVEFYHVKGHADNEYNELADKLAGSARRGNAT